MSGTVIPPSEVRLGYVSAASGLSAQLPRNLVNDFLELRVKITKNWMSQLQCKPKK